MKKAYSTNDEDYLYGDAGEALQAMADDDALREGATYYEIDTEAVRQLEITLENWSEDV